MAVSSSSIISPRCFNCSSCSEKSIACLVYCILLIIDVLMYKNTKSCRGTLSLKRRGRNYYCKSTVFI